MSGASDTAAGVIAIVAAHNEADVIAQVVGDLIRQGVAVYLLDHGSTDDTVAAVTPFLERGLLAIEPFPAACGVPAAEVAARPWESILRRKQQLARELPARWFIHHDADELRESLWPELSLSAAIARVDELGYNAIDFEVLDFPPIDDRFRPGDDLRMAFPCCERSPHWNKVQIRCWKRTDGAVDLVSSGGHEAVFAGRRVFPFRFLARHYPIRSQGHGRRKVLEERRPRFVAAERPRGWHRQYDDVTDDHCFLRDPAALTAYDPARVRLELLMHSRLEEELRDAPPARALREQALLRERDLLGAELDARNRELMRVHGELDERHRELEASHRELDRRQAELTRLRGDAAGLDVRLRDLERSLSWRLTAPLRAGLRRLRGY